MGNSDYILVGIDYHILSFSMTSKGNLCLPIRICSTQASNFDSLTVATSVKNNIDFCNINIPVVYIYKLENQ